MSKNNDEEKWRMVGRVGVDSGTLWIGDPCYTVTGDRFRPTKPLHELMTRQVVEYRVGDVFEEMLGLRVSVGIIVGGFGGDGVYPVLAKRNVRGMITGLLVDFSRIKDPALPHEMRP